MSPVSNNNSNNGAALLRASRTSSRISRSVANHRHAHGSVGSYVIGFVLSLVFTFIPYYMVVNQVVTGTTLLLSILSFAVLQLLVQVVFFLHLGRGPKPNWNLYFFISTVGIILIVVGGSIFIINNLVYNMLPSEQAKRLINDQGIYQVEGQLTGGCQGRGTVHEVTFSNSEVTPWYTAAKQCDTLLLINLGEEEVQIVFGNFPEYEVYAGKDHLVVRPGRNQTLTLSETGQYHFYDSRNPLSAGSFVVTED